MSQQESENVEQPSTRKGTTSASDAASPRSTKNPAQRRLAKQTAHPAKVAGQARTTATANEDKDISDYASALADFAASPLFAKIMGSEKEVLKKEAGKTPESVEDKNHHTVAKTTAEATTAPNSNEASLRQPAGKALPVTSSVIANTDETSGGETAVETIVSDQPAAQNPEADATTEVEIEEFARIGAEATPYPYRRYTQEEAPAPAKEQPASLDPASLDDDQMTAQGIVLEDDQELLQVHQAEALAEKFSAKTVDDTPQTTIIAEPEVAEAHDSADATAESVTASDMTPAATPETSQADNFDQAEALTIQFAAQPADFSTTTDANFAVETTALTGPAAEPATNPATSDDAEAEYITADLDPESTLPADEATDESTKKPVADAEPAGATNQVTDRPSPTSAAPKSADSNQPTSNTQASETASTSDAAVIADEKPEVTTSSAVPGSVAAAGAVAVGGSIAAGAAATAGAQAGETDTSSAETTDSVAATGATAQPQPATTTPVETASVDPAPVTKPSTPEIDPEQSATAAALAEDEEIPAAQNTVQPDTQLQNVEPEVERVDNAANRAASQQVKDTNFAGAAAESVSTDDKEPAEETAVSDSPATKAQAAAGAGSITTAETTTGTQVTAQAEPVAAASVDSAPAAKLGTSDVATAQSETTPQQEQPQSEATTAETTAQHTPVDNATAFDWAAEESTEPPAQQTEAQQTEKADRSAANIEPTNTMTPAATADTDAEVTSATAGGTQQPETLDASSVAVRPDAAKPLDTSTTGNAAATDTAAAQPKSVDTPAPAEPSDSDRVTDNAEPAQLQPAATESDEVTDTSAPDSPDTAAVTDAAAADFDQQAESVEPVAKSDSSMGTKIAGAAGVTGATAAGAAFLQRFKDQHPNAADASKQEVLSDKASVPAASTADDSLETPADAQPVESESVEETVVLPAAEDAKPEALHSEQPPAAPTAESDAAHEECTPEQAEHFPQEEAQTVQFMAQPVGYSTSDSTPDAAQADELDSPVAATDAPVEHTTADEADADLEQQAEQPSSETNTAHINFSDAATGATWVAERPNRETPETSQPDFATGVDGANAPYSLRGYGDDTVQPAGQLPDDMVFIPQQPATAPEEYHDEDFAGPPQQQVASSSVEAEEASNDARTLRADSMLPLAGETVQLDREPEPVNPQVTEYSSGPGKKPIRAAAILLADDSTDTPSSTAAPVKKSRNKRLLIVLTFLVLLFVAVACVAGYLFTRNSATSQPTDGSLAAPKSGIALEGAETPAESIPPSAMRLQAEDAHAEPLGIAGATLKIETSESLHQAVAYIEGQPHTEAQLQVWTRDENQDYVFRGPIAPDQTIDLTPENTLLAIVAADAPFEEGTLPPLFPGGEILVETIIWP